MQLQRSKTIANQVSTILVNRIHEKQYLLGSRLPSESELAEEFGVSRATIRTVLATLASEGLIIRKQGDGTYVNSHLKDVHTRLGGIWDFSRLIENSGRTASIQLVLSKTRAASTREAKALGLEADDKVLALDRIFLADEQPVVLAHNAIPLHLIEQKVEPKSLEQGDDFDGELPIHEFVRQYCHQEIAYGIFQIEAELLDPSLVHMLKCSAQTPLLKLSQIFYNQDNQPLLCGLSHYNDKSLQLRLVQTWT